MAAATARPIACADIEEAAHRIAAHVRVTPVMELARGALGGDWVPVLKCEFMQTAGSFKPRGAFNAMLSKPIGSAGVAAASGGNHGAAIAAAQGWLWRELRIAVEPGGATALAAVLCGAYQPRPGERVGILLCGGNVDLGRLADLAP